MPNDQDSISRNVSRDRHGLTRSWTALKVSSGEGHEPEAFTLENIPNISLEKPQIMPQMCSKCGGPMPDGENIDVSLDEGVITAFHKVCPESKKKVTKHGKRNKKHS